MTVSTCGACPATVTHREAFAAALARTVRPGGRIAVIDFAPGTLWFHGADHGVTPDAVEAAFRRAGSMVRERDDDWGGGDLPAGVRRRRRVSLAAVGRASDRPYRRLASDFRCARGIPWPASGCVAEAR